MGMFGKLADLKGVRRFENAFTGARLTGKGHLLGSALGVGAVAGKAMYGNSSPKPQVFNKAPGIRQAPAMSYDFKNNPNMGVSGALTLALGDIESPLGKY